MPGHTVRTEGALRTGRCGWGAPAPGSGLQLRSPHLSHLSLATLLSVAPWALSVHTLLSHAAGHLTDLSLSPPLLDREPVRWDQVCLGHCWVPSMGTAQSSMLAD